MSDEKHPEIIYAAVPVDDKDIEIEAFEIRKKQRPLWRRVVRVLLAITVFSMLWSTFAPVVHHKCMRHHHKNQSPFGSDEHHHHEHKHKDHAPTPEQLLNAEIQAGKPLQHYTFPADIDNFWIRQSSFHSPTRTNVIGKLVVASCEKAENISAHFKFDASDDSLLEQIEISPKKDGIVFKLDPITFVKQTINATIFVVIPKKDDYELNRLRVGTIQLDVKLAEAFTTHVNYSKISTVSGNIAALGEEDKLIDVNALKIETVSGTINGHFPLNHALALESTSGSITAHVDSGKLPEKKAWFKTETTSGSTNVAFDGDLHPRPLYSKHTSVSGAVNVHYPADWQGGLKIETTSGAIDVVGKGTKIIKKEKNVVGKLWEVIKGDGLSKGYIGTVSGSIDVAIGVVDE